MSELRENVLRAARTALVETGELHMGDVARRAGVGRSSLYRMCRDRDGLRELVLQWMAEIGWERALETARRRRGRAHCIAVITVYAELSATDPGLRRGMQVAPERTLALSTDHHGSVQPWVVDQVAKLLVEHADDLELTMPVDQLAYAIVRLGESFVYSDVLADREVDLAAYVKLVGLLLPPRAD